MSKFEFRWSWAGFVASILAIGLVGGWVSSVILIAKLGESHVIPEYVVQAQQALGQTLAGGVVGFLGALGTMAHVSNRSQAASSTKTIQEETPE